MTSTITCPSCNYRWVVAGTFEEKQARMQDWVLHQCPQSNPPKKPPWKKK